MSDEILRNLERNFSAHPTYAAMLQLNLARARAGFDPELNNWWFENMMGEMAAIITDNPCFRYTYYQNGTVGSTRKALQMCREEGFDVTELKADTELAHNFMYNSNIKGTYRDLYYEIAKHTGLGYSSWRVTVHDNPPQRGPGAVFIGLAHSHWGKFQNLNLHGGIAAQLDEEPETPEITLLESWMYDPVGFLDYLADTFHDWQVYIEEHRQDRRNPTRAENILEGRGCLGRAEAEQVAKSIKGSLASLRGTRQISGSVERGVLRLLKDATLAPKITKSGRSFPSPEQRYSRVKLAQKMIAPLYIRGPGSRKIIHRPIEEEGKDPRLGHLFGEEYRSVAARYRYNPYDEYCESCDYLVEWCEYCEMSYCQCSPCDC